MHLPTFTWPAALTAPLLVPANKQVEIDVADFAVPDYSRFSYLTAVKTRTSITTKYEVEVL